MAEAEKAKVTVDRDKYTTARSASGKKSLHNGDPVAKALEGLPLEAVHALGTKLLKEDTEGKYKHLNGGMQRMNVGNRLRKFVNAGEEGEDRVAKLNDAAAPHQSRAAKAIEKADAVKAKVAKDREAAKAKEAKAKGAAKGKGKAA